MKSQSTVELVIILGAVLFLAVVLLAIMQPFSTSIERSNPDLAWKTGPISVEKLDLGTVNYIQLENKLLQTVTVDSVNATTNVTIVLVENVTILAEHSEIINITSYITNASFACTPGDVLEPTIQISFRRAQTNVSETFSFEKGRVVCN